MSVSRFFFAVTLSRSVVLPWRWPCEVPLGAEYYTRSFVARFSLPMNARYFGLSYTPNGREKSIHSLYKKPARPAFIQIDPGFYSLTYLSLLRLQVLKFLLLSRGSAYNRAYEVVTPSVLLCLSSIAPHILRPVHALADRALALPQF